MGKNPLIKNDTIAAIATPPGKGGVGVIRVSGKKCEAIAKSIFKKVPKPWSVVFGSFYDEKKKIVDSGFLLFFKAPKSFTGEDVLEFHAHGGPVVLNILLKRILSLGARLAEPGEFSKRAFLNGKMDLTQAEAIADLIDADSEQAARSATRSLQGEFASHIHALVEKVSALRVYIEASIDFAEEEIDFLKEGQVLKTAKNILSSLKKIETIAKQGVLLKEGVSVVIAGEPNVGKSTLLNQLSGYEAAIVTEIPGTTRDVLREHIEIDGVPLHIIDTAGLRETADLIEQEGVRRAKHEIKKADLVLFLEDTTRKTNASKKAIIDFGNKKIILIRNKIDLLRKKACVEQENESTIIYLSAKTGEGISLLKKTIKEKIGATASSEGQFIARERHLEALALAKKHLQLAIEQCQAQKTELLAEELRETQQALSMITGEFTTEDLLHRIFSSFCVGK